MYLQVTWDTILCDLASFPNLSDPPHSIIYWTNDNAALGTVREDQGLESQGGQSLPSALQIPWLQDIPPI